MGRISMPQGKGSQMHNRRDYDKIGQPLPNNIDASRTVQNVTLVDLDIRQAYKDIFGQALDEYNAKQKRADRKINDYYDHILKSKNGEKPFYEDVVQWGAKEDFDGYGSIYPRVSAKAALEEYALTFEQRNPNLKVIGAYIHMDEASPHLHIDYIPVAHGYTRGLTVRNSLDRAMKEMGFTPEDESRKNNATKLWKERERKAFAAICLDHRLIVDEEGKARGSLSVEEYKAARAEQERKVNGEIFSLKTQKQELEQEVLHLQWDVESALKTAENKIAQQEQRLAQLEKTAEKVYAVETSEDNLILKFLQIPEMAQKFAAFCQQEQKKAEKEKQDVRKSIEKVLERPTALVARIRESFTERQREKAAIREQLKQQELQRQQEQAEIAAKQQETINTLKRMEQAAPAYNNYAARIKCIEYAYPLCRRDVWVPSEVSELARKVLSKMGVYCDSNTEPQKLERNVESVLNECENGLRHESRLLSVQDFSAAADDERRNLPSPDAPTLNSQRHDYDVR